MIVKLAPNRHDGNSSFSQLGAYITNGISQSGDRADRTSWKDLTQYITKQSVLNELGDAVEKTIGVEIGNVSSLATAADAMAAVAAKATKDVNPVLHLILSWPEHERPEPQPIFEAARHVINSLGLAEHQYIIAIHDNTENRHAHIEVNRIHPKTYRPARLEWMLKTMHRAAREAEIEQGWAHDNGLFEVIEVNGKKFIVEAKDRDRLEGATSYGANRVETWTGEVSLETWCRGAPADALRAAIDAPELQSWQDLHDTLASFGLELRDSGGRGMRVHDVSAPAGTDEGKGATVSASKAFRFLKRAELESRLGSFQPSRLASKPAEQIATYKRDPMKRLERKLEQKQVRDALHGRFSTELAAAREQRQVMREALAAEFGREDAARTAALQASYRERRAAITADPRLDRKTKQQMHMLAKAAHSQARAQLRLQMQQERAQKRELLAELPTWRTWVEREAAAGDEGAISALRGMVYQDGREAKKTAGLVEAEKISDVGIIKPARLTQTEPYIRAIQRLTWQVSSHGTVTYSLDKNKAAFIDAGSKLRFGGAQVANDELKIALMYAADKWRGTLRLNGGDRAFRERVARVAADMNIQLLNPDLRALQRQHIAAQRAPAALPYPHPVPAEQQTAFLARKYQSLPLHREDVSHAFQNPYSTRSGPGRSTLHPAAAAAAANHAHAFGAARGPATETLDGLRNLSSGTVARLTSEGIVLLPDHARHQLVDAGAQPSDALRRNADGDGRAGGEGRVGGSPALASVGTHRGEIVSRDNSYVYQQTKSGRVRNAYPEALASIPIGSAVEIRYVNGSPPTVRSLPATKNRDR